MLILRNLRAHELYLTRIVKPVILKAFSTKMSSTDTDMCKRKFRVALVQFKVGKQYPVNMDNALRYIRQAKQGGAELICLPECFNSPYGVNFFRDNAQPIPDGSTCRMLSEAARENSVYIIGGTIPEIENDLLYNTCTVWHPTGAMIAKYRKMHLFDIDIPGGITFKESDVLKSGNELSTFNMGHIKIGLGICYDLRFEELAKLYRKQGCDVLIYPGAFNMTTGPMHWELLQRARALDNQLFVCAISPARGEKGYIAWGHSQVTDPWGKVVAQASSGEEVVYHDIDLRICDEIRQQIPVFVQRRKDVYDTVLLNSASK